MFEKVLTSSVVGTHCERRLFVAVAVVVVTFEERTSPEKRFETKSSSDSSKYFRLLFVRILVVADVNVHVLVGMKAEVELRDVVEDCQGQGHEDQPEKKIACHIKYVLFTSNSYIFFIGKDWKIINE